MSQASAKRTKVHVLSERFAEPDLVDRIFDYIVEQIPELRQGNVADIKARMRSEFKGEHVYIPKVGMSERQARDAAIRRMFNGRNATEVARVMGISRATVYRCLKQPAEPAVEA